MRLCLFYLITFFLFLGVQADKGANKRTGEKGGEKGGGSGKFSSNLADADSDKMAKERKEGIAKLWKRWHYQMEKHGYTLPFSKINKDSTAASGAVTPAAADTTTAAA